MMLKLDRPEHRDVISTMLDLIDEAFEGVVSRNLGESTFYLVLPGGKVDDLVKHLKDRRMDSFIRVFTDDEFRDKEVVFCIANGDGKIQSIVAKVSARRGSGYTDISMSYLIKQFLEILQSRGLIARMSSMQEKAMNDYIISEIPPRMAARAEAVHMQNRPVPNIYV
jgi:hypothetical protein